MDNILEILLAAIALGAFYFGWKTQRKALHYRKKYLEKVRDDTKLDPRKEQDVRKAKAIFDRLRDRLMDDPGGNNGTGSGGTEDPEK